MALPNDLLAIAAHQYSCFSNVQARAAGVSQDVLDNRKASGEIVSPTRAVYVLAGTTPSYEQRLMVACLGGGPGTYVSHRSAGQVWELLDLDDPPVEVTTPRWRSARLDAAGILQHRPLDLTPGQVTVRRSLPITNPLRTMIDLCGVVDIEVAQEALDAGIGTKLFTVEAVDRMRRRLAKPGRTGTGKTKELLDAQVIRDVNRSVLEATMSRAWTKGGLPPFSFQHNVRTPEGRFVARVDFAIPELKIAIEVKGWRRHSSPVAVDADDRRTNRLSALGWTTLEFSWWRVKHEPEQVLAEIWAVVSVRLTAS